MEKIIYEQILQNQILIMEQLLRITSYPHIEEEMKKAIEDSKIVISNIKNVA